MKKTILATIAAILILSIIIPARLTSHTQSIKLMHEPSEVSDENQQATSMETTENAGKLQDCGETSTSPNQDCSLDDTEETENMQGLTANDPPENPADTSQDQNTRRKVYPPDGRIYWTPESPCAYIPTCGPKGLTDLPIMPPELEN